MARPPFGHQARALARPAATFVPGWRRLGIQSHYFDGDALSLCRRAEVVGPAVAALRDAVSTEPQFLDRCHACWLIATANEQDE